ncbi:ParA family protein [Pannonibacter phragmitetus]|uniref:ParA family protein n=1 Tax=Pannonibacter phragmitetus TaxID=121719 RepID=UPI003D2F1877
MRSVAFFNNKGGVGKTTLLCNVAAYAALHLNKRVAVVDADPQCNATQYIFNDNVLDEIYGNNGFTIYDIIDPLTVGEGFSHELKMRKSDDFGFDVLPGDPRLALTEDFLAQDWSSAKSGNVRGIKTNLVFSDLLSRMEGYDVVFLMLVHLWGRLIDLYCWRQTILLAQCL